MNSRDGLVLCSGCAAKAACHVAAEHRTAMAHFIILSDDDTYYGGRLTSTNCIFTRHPQNGAIMKQR